LIVWLRFAARKGRSVLKKSFGPDCCAFDIDVDSDIRGVGMAGQVFLPAVA
jgi:hypothetical protein